MSSPSSRQGGQQGSQQGSQRHLIHIEAPREQVWAALTDPDLTERIGSGGRVEVVLEPGGPYWAHTTDAMKRRGLGDVAVTGSVVAVDPPRLLTLDWRATWHDEPASRVTWQIDEGPAGVSRVTLTHELPESPLTAVDVAGTGEGEAGGGGWPWELSSLKTLLETGRPMAGAGAQPD